MSRWSVTSEGGAEEHTQILTRQTEGELAGRRADRLMLSDHLLKFFSSSPSFAGEIISLSLSESQSLCVPQSHTHTHTHQHKHTLLSVRIFNLSPPLYQSVTPSLWKHRLRSAKKKSTQSIPLVLWLTCSPTHDTLSKPPFTCTEHFLDHWANSFTYPR